MPASVVTLTWGPQPRGRRLRGHVAALCARGGCIPVSAFGGAADLGADVVATNADGFLVVVPGRHCADGNRVGSQDLRRFGGTCFAVDEADVAVVVTTSSAAAPAAEYTATCGMVCADGGALAARTVGRTPALGRAAASTYRGCPRRDGTLFMGRAIANAPACHRRCLSSVRTVGRGSAAGSTREVP